MKIKSLIQGTPEWHRHRATSRNASDASAVMGCSPYKTRAQLLDERATGIVPEVDAATQKRFDRGHAIEEAARPVAETMIGDDLYPIIGTDDDGYLSASFDGLTMDGKTAWECKTFNAGKAEEVAIGDIPEADFWQCVQQLYVSGAERLYYTLSDGTEEGSVHCHLTRDRAADFFDDLLAGWKQFDEDLANHKPRQVETAIVGAAPESLPAIHIELTGMVTASNLAEVREQALSVFRSINRDLQTDEDFANAEKTVKWCGEIEKKLDAAKEHALAQTASISELFSTLDQIKAEARETRLALDKQVKAQKEERKRTIVMERQNALRDHCDKLQASIGKIVLPPVSADFAGAIKGKRSFAMMEDALDDELARAKIEANTTADHIRASVEILRSDAAGYEGLFADAQQIVGKDHDDLRNLIHTRIAEYKAAEEKRLEQERERIRAEEQRKAEDEAQRKAAEEAQRIRTEEQAEFEESRQQQEPATTDKPEPGAPASESDAIEAMQKYGGSFAAALGVAWSRADEHNRQRLRKAFPELLAEYTKLAEQKAAAA